MNAHYVRGTCRGWGGGEPYLLCMITMIWHMIYQVTHWKDSPGECQEPGFGQDVFVVYLMVPSVSNSIETNKNESNEHTIIPFNFFAHRKFVIQDLQSIGRRYHHYGSLQIKVRYY